MHNTRKSLFAALFAVLSVAASAGLDAVTLFKNDVRDIQYPSRAVALQVSSTNNSGQVKVEKISPFTYRWTETCVTTTPVYVEIETNLYHEVTNDHVTVWRTRYLGAGVVESNEYASAVNDTPAFPEWPGMVVTTNKVPETVSYTNWTVRVESGSLTLTNDVVRSITRTVTNNIYSGTVNGGFFFTLTNLNNVLIFPDDRLSASGSYFDGGRAILMLER